MSKNKPSAAALPSSDDDTPKMPKNILLKLFAFTAILFVLPLLSFFMCNQFLVQANKEMIGAVVAVISANLVILVFIWTVFSEEEKELVKTKKAKEERDRKSEKSHDATADGKDSSNKQEAASVTSSAKGNSQVRRRK